MKKLRILASFAVILASATVALATPSAAQQAQPAAIAQPTTQAPTAPAQPSVEAAVATTDGKPRSMTLALHELSPWSMFLAADILVKAVMISLAFASLVTWTIFLAKTIQLFQARRRLSGALSRIKKVRTLSEAQLAVGATSPLLSSLLVAAVQEIRMSFESSADSRIQERAMSSFSEIVRAEARAVRSGMGVIATIGATSPFVGLFGTVWGIMNSFIGISKSQTTNLAVVAPGIAEALLATAIGLIAAIPAVIIYNHFSRATKGYLEIVGRASGAVARLLSRDLDRSHARVLSNVAE